MLRPLTALRFAAALLVFPWHAALTRSAAMHFSLGYAGVTFFYVLSGFILTYKYEPLFRNGWNLQALRSFWVARFARVYPVHLFAFCLMLALLALIGGDHWNVDARTRLAEAAAQIVLIQSWFPAQDMHFGINGPAWSISVEAFFYALFPALLIACVRAFSAASERLILCAIAAIVTAYALALSQVHAVFDQWSLYVFAPVRLIDFTIGVLLALAFMRRKSPRGARVDATTWEVAAIAAFLIGLECTVYVPQSERFAAVFLPFSAFAIYVFASGGGAISRVLGAPHWVRLGEASYAFYLLHLGIVQAVERVLGPERKVVAWFLALAVSVLASLAVYGWLETPLRRRIRAAWSGNAILGRAEGTTPAWQRYSAKAETKFS